MSRFFAFFLLFSTFSAPSVVSAQSDADADVAVAMMRRAQEAYDMGDFERAAVLLEESVELYEAPAIHYNLARTFSELSRWEDARFHFERFLELSPESQQRDAVEARIAELDRRIERQEVAARPPPLVETPDPQSEAETILEESPVEVPPRNIAPLLILGGGAVVALAAIPFGVASDNAAERAAEAPTHREGAAELDTARRHARVTNALWVTGGVLVALGLIWTLLKPRRSEVQATFDGTLHVRF